MDAFAVDHQSLNLYVGTLNTVLLLTSSLFVALAVQRMSVTVDGASRLLRLAMLCGCGFVALKALGVVTSIPCTQGYGQRPILRLLLCSHGSAPSARGHWIGRSDQDECRRAQCGQWRACTSHLRNRGNHWHMVDLLWVLLFALFYVVR
jgi:nitric oxide reductase NorE protein